MGTQADSIKSHDRDLTTVSLLFELSGEHSGLSILDVSSAIEALSGVIPSITNESSIAIVETDVDPVDIGERIALCHRVDEIVESGSLESLLEAAKNIKIRGSVAARCRKVSRARKERCPEIVKQFGAILAESHSIDLDEPSTVIRIILAEESHLAIQRHEVDRTSFEERKVALRPFFYPISLHPKFARLLVNMTKVRKGEFEGLREAVKTDPDRLPDFGKAELHPTAGATVVGARPYLIAYNVNLNTSDISIAKNIAKVIGCQGLMRVFAAIYGNY